MAVWDGLWESVGREVREGVGIVWEGVFSRGSQGVSAEGLGECGWRRFLGGGIGGGLIL